MTFGLHCISMDLANDKPPHLLVSDIEGIEVE